MIDYRLLQALAAVIKNGSFEKAAKHLHITQSAVSRRINRLESLLGEPVIVRCQPPRATKTGTKLLNHLQQVQQLEVSIGVGFQPDDPDNNLPLTITLASNADSLATWLPEALAFPGFDSEKKLSFDISIVDQSVGLNKMKSGEVMACICDSSKPVNGGLSRYLGDLQYQVVASPNFIHRHQLNGIKGLHELPCLVFDQDDQLQHRFLQKYCGHAPKYIHLCPSSEGFKQACIAGLGYGLLPTLQIDDAISAGALVDLRPDYTLDTSLYWHYWQTESEQLKSLREHALAISRRVLPQSAT
ncbi:LysR family transcriptional regulator ArgP [Agaribacter marinus]|uniref:HTH-type transcriptional regulator ArgP n=1 Tax=Agaribacter marinus TaxID=1431249 RepID=A0AA37T404_9ALTE|nr:LysR family transcriptional regulator ArgP [Agaribacter marinus]GLR71708.1 HTH-type transcriptional regulator ArgP [Agaribacter marinus]